MKSPRRTMSIFAAIMMVLTGFGGFMTGASAQDPSVLRLGTNAADVVNLDPHIASATADRTIVDMVFNGLVRFNAGDSSSFVPDIATELPAPQDQADGTQIWSFTLRDDVMCQPSASTQAYALTSADVLFSFQKAANADTSNVAGDYAGWTFAAPDPQPFTITVETPISETLLLPKVANYAGGYIICQQPYEALGADGFITNPVGTGPFMFESYTTQSNVTLTANPDFFRGAPQLGGVEVRFVADTTSRELALQSGDLDVISGLPEAQWVDRINETEGIQADVFGVGEVVFLNLNVEHEILKDPLVREAILLAVDRESHVALSGSPVSEPVYSIVPVDFMPGGLTEEAATEAGVISAPDVERAKQLLAEAGYPEGFELDLVSSEQDSYLRAYTVLQEQLAQIGITVNLEPVQHQSMHDLIRQDVNPITIYVAFRPTADVYLTQFFSTDGGTTNFSKFTVDDLVTQARAETDPEAQAAIWEQANVAILENFAGYGLMYTNQVYAKTDAIDYGHELVSVVQLYPGIDETTTKSS
ncbi:MAG: ABC transporter substrate-binding protein [Chloroflexota bacterium]|nr:ABC transporter substrate-binding protein [Chloroflexota bacterium]